MEALLEATRPVAVRRWDSRSQDRNTVYTFGRPYVRELPSLVRQCRRRQTLPLRTIFRRLRPGPVEFCDDDCSKRAKQDEEAR